MPDAAQAQGDLLDQVEQRVALHAHRLVWIEFDALLGDGEVAKVGASQSRDGHQIMGPYDVTFRGTQTFRDLKLKNPNQPAFPILNQSQGYPTQSKWTHRG